MDVSKNGAAANALLAELADGQPQVIERLADRLNLNRRQVSDAAAKLERRNWIDRPSVGTYVLTDAGRSALAEGLRVTSGPLGPTRARRLLKDTFRQRAWSAMRVRRIFTIGEIVSDAGRGDPEAERDNARRYITALVSGGYVAEHPRRKPGTALTSPGFKEFRLKVNNGPKAPVFSEARQALHDPNLGKDVSCAPR